MAFKTTTVVHDGKVNCNKIKLCGTITGDLILDHEIVEHNVKYYRGIVSVERPSGIIDKIPYMVSDAEFDISNLTDGTRVLIYGQFRSHNIKKTENKSKLLLFVYCLDINILTEEEFAAQNNLDNNNNLTLMGYVCKPPVFRETPSGKHISDIFIVSNRGYKKMDFIPCIAWNSIAHYVSKFNVGDFVIIEGRIQSREYNKKDENGNILSVNTAYEVSTKKVYKASVSTKNNNKKKNN